VPFGNEFEVVTDEGAYKTLDAAWTAGVRYYDVAPWYGLGLAERRYGAFLHNKNRDEYILSSKVGKLLKASPHNNGKSNFPFSPSPNNVVFDYTADGVRRSIEDSLQRLGVSDLDIVFVHDISSDNKLLPTPWQEQFAIALKGAFPALARMKSEGMIRGWGIGVNTPEPILRVMQEADPDVCLLASQYSLIDHANALDNVFPVARQQNVKFVIGSSLNAGFISGSPRYNYGKMSWDISRQHIDKRERLRAVAAQFGVDLRTAALRFSAAPDVAAALIVGAHTEGQVLANVTSMQATIPPEFWAELKRQKLIEENAPIPT
jgi:D-threo-aldose 1-dehydrogenase